MLSEHERKVRAGGLWVRVAGREHESVCVRACADGMWRTPRACRGMLARKWTDKAACYKHAQCSADFFHV